MNIKKAIAHSTYTAFCSSKISITNEIDAGYVYLFGILSTQASKLNTVSHKIGSVITTSLTKSNS